MKDMVARSFKTSDVMSNFGPWQSKQSMPLMAKTSVAVSIITFSSLLLYPRKMLETHTLDSGSSTVIEAVDPNFFFSKLMFP